MFLKYCFLAPQIPQIPRETWIYRAATGLNHNMNDGSGRPRCTYTVEGKWPPMPVWNFFLWFCLLSFAMVVCVYIDLWVALLHCLSCTCQKKGGRQATKSGRCWSDSGLHGTSGISGVSTGNPPQKGKKPKKQGVLIPEDFAATVCLTVAWKEKDWSPRSCWWSLKG